MPNISIVWDFDGTLTPFDSTTQTVEVLDGEKPGAEFWSYIKELRGDGALPEWKHIQAMDAPIWMYALSRLAFKRRVPLNKEFFVEFVLPRINLFEGVIPFLKKIKDMEHDERYGKVEAKIHHFIVSAGLKELIENVFPEGLITGTFGCRYTITAHPDHPDEPESIPVFCMDETTKTRALFEISKGSFLNKDRGVNKRIEEGDLWCSFKDMIYIGDGETDIPSMSLVRAKGGIGIAVYDPQKEPGSVEKKLRVMSLDKRADLITPANYSFESELFAYIESRCNQIRQRYEAELRFK